MNSAVSTAGNRRIGKNCIAKVENTFYNTFVLKILNKILRIFRLF